jgi:hypothetical protein
MDTILAPINAAKAMGLVLVAIGTFHAVSFRHNCNRTREF